MTMASWMIRRTYGKSKRLAEDDPDFVKLDLKNDPFLNTLELLSGICSSSGMSESKLLNYLNAYVKLVKYLDCSYTQMGFSCEEVFCCLRVTCVHEAVHVRTATLRALRCSIKTEDHVMTLCSLQYPYLIARSLDLALCNDIERVQAMKLIRRIILLAPKLFHPCMARSLVSLANGSPEEKDRMLRACLAALTELAILNPEVFISTGGVHAIIRNILECQTPRIAESLCGTLLHLLNYPYTRELAAIDLECLAAPYCDFHYRKKNSTGAEKSEMAEERDLRFNCSRLALLSVLRSWPGILHFCNPNNQTCLKAIVEILYLEHLEVKNAVLDLLYELLNLPQPEWTDEFSVALNAVDPADPQDSWRLGDGFVAAEGRSVLPHLARTTPNLSEIHLAVLLYTFMEVGLFTALAEVIVSGDTFICVRATVLLGELLHLAHQLLPPDCCNTTPPLPNLLMHATNKHLALAAVAALQNLHTMLKQRPATHSLFLDHILQTSNFLNRTNTLTQTIKKVRSLTSKSKLYQFVMRDNEDMLRNSAVLQNKDGYTWDWDIIRTILKDNIETAKKLEDSNHKAFIKRLLHYFKPSSNRFSHMDLGSVRQTQKYTLSGCDLINYLLVAEADGLKLLSELFADISVQIDAITTSKTAHDCLFSPQHMHNTCCQKYFLFVGQLSRSPKGIDILTKTGIFEQLLKLSTSTNHDCYVKLIISSLDYTMDAFPRRILSKTLTCNQKGSRLYATQFLLVMLRARVTSFEQWGVNLLVDQLFDQSKAVSLTALNILHEACEEKIYLEKLVSLKPNLLHLGDKGLLLLIRFVSTASGYSFLQQSDFLTNEIARWSKTFNYRYVRIIEEDLHDSLTLHQRNDEGHYDKRISSLKTVYPKDIFVPPHLYGQLVQHAKGFNTLVESVDLNALFQTVEKAECSTEAEILELKAALWACGNIATSAQGIDLLVSNGVLSNTINVVKTCPVYALRGTAIFVLGLMSTTYKGANELFKLGWVCTRHDRHERWPIIEGENWDLDSQVTAPNADKPTAESESDQVSENSSSQTYWTEDTAKTEEYFLPDPEGSGTDEDIFLASENVSQPRSQTLPHSTSAPAPMHKRSMSESKTADVLSGDQRSDQTMKSVASRISSQTSVGNRSSELLPPRYRAVSESSTSGVSSCDSTVGKFIINDKMQTLSPIPSSSSLSTLKSTIFQRQRRKSEFARKISTQSNPPLDMLTISPPDSSRLSYQDLLGYTRMRSLRHRPLYSETSVDELSSLVKGNEKVKLGSSLGSRSLKVRSLDRQHTQLSLTSDVDCSSFPNQILCGGISSASLTSMSKRTGLLRNSEKNGGQCYMGISMPRNLLEIFPNEQLNLKGIFIAADSVSRSMDADNKFGKKKCVQEAETGISLNQNTLTYLKHDTTNCLSCYRLKNTHKKTHLWQTSAMSIERAKQEGTSKDCVSPEIHDPKIKLDILRHIERLSNPVWYKQSRQGLLQTKQKYPQQFQDICLYSEACKIIGGVTLRLMARRFFQELFQDLNFDSFLQEPQQLLCDKKLGVKSGELPILSSDTQNISRCKNRGDGSIRNVQESLSSDPSKINYFVTDSAQRSAELSCLIQAKDPPCKVVASDSNLNVTKGFLIDSSALSSKPDLEKNGLNNETKQFNPLRSPPLASVKEETLSSVENLLDKSYDSKHRNSQDNRLYSDPFPECADNNSKKLISPRGQKTLVDSLSLTCSKNIFPITTRYEHKPTVTRSYSFSRTQTSSGASIVTRPLSTQFPKRPNLNATSPSQTFDTNTKLNSVSATQSVPKPKINKTA